MSTPICHRTIGPTPDLSRFSAAVRLDAIARGVMTEPRPCIGSACAAWDAHPGDDGATGRCGLVSRAKNFPDPATTTDAAEEPTPWP